MSLASMSPERRGSPSFGPYWALPSLAIDGEHIGLSRTVYLRVISSLDSYGTVNVFGFVLTVVSRLVAPLVVVV